MKRPLLLFVVTEDWYFVSHRLCLARAAVAVGYDVAVATRVQKHGEVIEQAGIKLIPIRMNRSSRNPFAELLATLELVRIYLRLRPSIVHHVAIKPVLYGSVAAWCAGVPGVVNAIAGLGYLFVSGSRKTALLRGVVKYAFRLLFSRPNTRVIVQNPDDFDAMRESLAMPPERLCLIRGSGVDLDAFPARPPMQGRPLVILPARMLWDKGVGEFVEAARLLQQQGVEARFRLVGDADDANPAAISRQQLQAWVDEGVVEWSGWCDDMSSVMAESRIVCLPSYREGLPKALLEAAASSRAIVATDVPGCREIVVPGVNGLLVEARSAEALVPALRQLIEDPLVCEKMGRAGRTMVEGEFSMGAVAEKTLSLYKSLPGVALTRDMQ